MENDYLINGWNRKKDNRKIFLKKRRIKKINLGSSKFQHFKAIKKFLINEDFGKNETNLLKLRTYSVDNSKLDEIKS